MEKLFRIVLKVLRKGYIFLFKPKPVLKTDYVGQASSDKIKTLIDGGEPLMIARFGSVELRAMIAARSYQLGFIKYLKYIKGDIPDYELRDYIISTAHINAGIFPPEKEIISKFGALLERDIQDLDILGTWLFFEKEVISRDLIQIPLKDLEPYYHKNPWTKSLKNKKVLVIHPFTDSIKKQYQKRSVLFQDPDILPEFDLLLIKAIQSAAGVKNDNYPTWFDALEHMKNQINVLDFDIAIIGCGAYGFSLAAHIKRMGKQAIHLGGATQILFGIKGNRWENHPFISKLYNEHWIRPNELETPKSSVSVEDGCYW